MVDTPWGPSESLRERMLRPGPGIPSTDVARHQRERLFAAMVASVAERGYAATRVTDLVELSGVSRRSFYDLFPDKLACFKAAIEELIGLVLAAAYSPEVDAMPWEERARARLDAFVDVMLRHTAAARMCMVESYAAGPEATKPLEDAMTAVEYVTAQSILDSPEHAGAPPELIAAAIRAAVDIVRARLRRGEEQELPKLAPALLDAIIAYEAPPEPLRLGTRPPPPVEESLSGHDHAERIIRAFATVVAECGYQGTTIDQVVKRATMSPNTFYATFSGKEDVLMAAIDSAGAQIGAAVLPAYRRNPDWPSAVRAAIGALFSFLASRPALAQLIIVEIHGAGPEAVERRDAVLAPLRAILAEARRRSPSLTPMAVEVIAASIFALGYRQIRDEGPASLPLLAPVCTYVALAPVVGPQRACEAANGGGRLPTGEEGRARTEPRDPAAPARPGSRGFSSRTSFRVDEQGWRELLEVHAGALDATEEIVAASRKRLEESGEQGVEGRSVQTLHETPGEDAPDT